MNSKNSDHYFLKGGGEMGELIRATDWSKTSLGDPAAWPQSLRTMVAVMLDNPFGMYIAWGTEYIQLYNDGYRPILGATKHPQALGISTRETFSEIWHIIESMFAGVMHGKAVGFPDFMLPLNRYGYQEECYFDFSYSPIRRDNGEVGGILVTVIETTEKKRATDALKESNARYINNIMQAPVAMCIFRGENYVVEIANEQMLTIWGKQAAQVLNKPIFEGLPEAKDQGLEALLANVYMTGEKFVANERPVKLPRNGKTENTYLNFVYDALKEADGTISGIVAIAIEVTLQVVARSKVEESEQKVRALVENAPFPIAVYAGKEMIVELANQSIIDIWGKGNDVIGKSFKEILPELDNQLVFEQIEKVNSTGESFHSKNTPLDLVVDGKLQTFYFNYGLTPLYDIGGNIYGVMNTGVDLTDLNIAKKQIEESEQNIRSMVLQSPIGICVIDADTLVSEIVNDSFVEIAGKAYGEIAGKHYWDTFAEAKVYYESALNKVIKEGKSFYANEVEMMLIRHGKEEVIYVTFVYAPLKNIEGIVKKVAIWVLDNTPQVVTRRKIEEADKRFRNTVKQAPVGITILRGSQYVVEMANDAYLQLVGRNEEGFIGKALFDVLPEVEETVRSLLDSVLTTGVPYRGSEVAVPLNRYGKQEIYYFDFLYHPLKEEDGKISGVIVTVTEVGEKVEARKKIEESEKRFRSLAESLPQLVWETDEKGNALFASAKWKEYIGISPDGEAEWKAMIHPDDFEENAKTWQRSLATGDLYRHDVRIKSKSGEYRWYTVIGEPVSDKENKIVKWVGAFTDIHTEKAFTQELEKQVAQRTKELGDINIELGKKNKELQTFAYISSHDLQEPLRKIQTFSTQIIEKEFQNLSEGGKDKFRRMENAANRMQTLIDDLLTYSQTNTQERKFEKVNLNTIVEAVKDDLKEQLQQKHAKIESDEMCEANIIPFQFRQLLFNLLNNSLKFSKSKESPHIKIKSEIAEGAKFKKDKLANEVKYCHISVSDNGIGFEQQYSEKIFDVFQRLHGKSEYNGTGIGLSIVKRIVENHNGIITARGELNKGATFDIYIPAT
ncbi:MAG TPA: PAS domain-containing protein [Chryseolinea sp.]|nr:PAS domain-containing protein [Chryseolinea sp.]